MLDAVGLADTIEAVQAVGRCAWLVGELNAVVGEHGVDPIGCSLDEIGQDQLRTAAQDPEGPDTLRIHLSAMDDRARALQNQPQPSQSGTKHLGRVDSMDSALS